MSKATIYDLPESIKVPELDFRDMESYRKAEEKFYEDLKAFCKKRKDGKNVGEIIKFPVADGYAMYMVASMKPLELIHIPIMDAWEFEYAHLLTAKEVQQKIDQKKALEELFAKNKKK
jgi:hypothetical protein